MSRAPEGSGSADGLVRMARDGVITRRECLRRIGILSGGLGLSEGPLSRALAQAPARADLVVAQAADISRLDPHFSTVVHDTAVSLNVFDTLTARRRDNRLAPSLALDWKLVGPTAWRFRLRPGVTFHSGESLTAEDVRFSIERTQDPRARTLVATVFGSVAHVEVIDTHTVVFHTRQPDPLLPGRLAFLGGQILSRDYVARVGSEGLNVRPVGSGPLRFVEHVRGDRLVLERVPGYWGGPVEFPRVVFRPIPETAPRVAALLAGEVDIITGLPPDHVGRVARHPAATVESALYAGLYLLVLDSRKPPLDQPKVKQALSLALDREAIVKELWHGQGLVPSGPIPKGDAHFDETLPPLAYDPARARERLREAGYRGEAIYLELAPGYLATDRAMSEAAVSMWRDVGLNVRLEILEYSVLMQKVRERTLKGMRWGAPASTLGDPDGMMWRLLGPGGIHDNWRHPRFDELGVAAGVSVDERFRAQAYRGMTAIFLDHFPWIPVIQPIEAYGLARGVDWKPYANQQFELRRFNLRPRRAS